MTSHRRQDRDARDPETGRSGRGLSGFVRSLLGNVPWSERLETHEVLRFPRPSAGTLRIHNPNGNVSVQGAERDDVEVRAIKVARAECEEGAEALIEQMRIAPAQLTGALEIEVQIPEKWNRRGTVHLEIQAPRGLAVELAAANGRIDVEGMRGPVRARSTNGSSIIRDVIGDISVSAANAKVSCARTAGRLIARSRDGKIDLQQHRGSIDACTSNGLIRVSIDELGKEGVQLATSNGRIVLDLPEDVDADVDVRVDNGTIRNELELCRCTKSSNGVVLGRLGAGGRLVKLRTSNGSVSLR